MNGNRALPDWMYGDKWSELEKQRLLMAADLTNLTWAQKRKLWDSSLRDVKLFLQHTPASTESPTRAIKL